MSLESPAGRRTRRGWPGSTRRLWVLGTLAVLALCAGCSPGPSVSVSPEAVVEAYITALNDRDRAAVEDLIEPEHTARNMVAEQLIDDRGGRHVSVANIMVQQHFGPYHATAQVTGTDAEGLYQEQLYLSRRGDRWYLTMGRTGADGSDATADTE